MEVEDSVLFAEGFQTNRKRTKSVNASTRKLSGNAYDPKTRSYKLLGNSETLGYEQLKQIQKKNFIKLQRENKERRLRFEQKNKDAELLEKEEEN